MSAAAGHENSAPEIFERVPQARQHENYSRERISRAARTKGLTPRISRRLDHSHSPWVKLPALLRSVMSTLRTHIAQTATSVRLLNRPADWSCMSFAKHGPIDRLEVSLIRKARV